MPVRVGVVAGGDLIEVAVGDERGHRVGRAAVHPDLAVGVQRHEPPGGVDQRVHHRQVQLVPFGDGTPVVHTGPAEWIGADANALGADGVQVHHIGQVLDIGVQVIVALRDLQRSRQRHPLHRLDALAQDLVRAIGNPAGGIGIRRPAVGRVVLESAVAGGGLCDGVTTIPSARSVSRPRLKVRMAWLTAGVGGV